MPEFADIFAKHFVQSIVYQRGLTEEDFLKHAYMKSALEFGSAKIEDYLGVVQTDIDMLPDFSESSKIVQVLEGIQPVSFRAMIHTKYPHIVSMADVKGAIAIIRGASQKEQKAIDDRKAGWGNHCKGPSNTTKQRDSDKKSEKSDVGRPRARGMGCTKCVDDHHISMCTSRCTRCPPPHCGKTPSQCPHYLARVAERNARKKGPLQVNHARASDNEESDERLAGRRELRKGRESRKEIRATAVKNYYSYYTSTSECHDREKENLQQPMTMIAPMINEIDTNGEHYHVNHVESRPKKNVTFGQDKVFLIDFGANGNFINSETSFDLHSVFPVKDSQVLLPDESGAVAEAVGTFCGEKAHLFPSFDKSLLCSEFFTNQNCAVLAIDDNLYVLKLNSKVLERLSN